MGGAAFDSPYESSAASEALALSDVRSSTIAADAANDAGRRVELPTQAAEKAPFAQGLVSAGGASAERSTASAECFSAARLLLDCCTTAARLLHDCCTLPRILLHLCGSPYPPLPRTPRRESCIPLSAGAELLDAFVSLDRPSKGTPHLSHQLAQGNQVAAAPPLTAWDSPPSDVKSPTERPQDGAKTEAAPMGGSAVGAKGRRVWLESSGEGTATLRFSGHEEGRAQAWLLRVGAGLLLLLYSSSSPRRRRRGRSEAKSGSWIAKPRRSA